jgi:hypothetical protein
VNATESEERLEHEGNLGRSLMKLISDKHLVIIRHHGDGLREDNTSDLIGNLRYRVGVEVNDVLMAPRFIGITVAMDSEVELLAAENKALVKR